MGRFCKAEQIYYKTLSFLEKTGGTEQPAVATIYHNLSEIEQARQHYQKAEYYARRAVEIRSRIFGGDHLDVAADKVALASVLVGCHKYDEAESLCQEALMIFEAAYQRQQSGKEINRAVKFGALYRGHGLTKRTEQHYQRAVSFLQLRSERQSRTVASYS